MKLTVFHATDGDCLMLESATGERVLIDGGREGSFEKHTRPVLEQLETEKKAIDLLVVSHIDADHISGVIPVLDAVGQWAGFQHRLATARAAERKTLPQPSVPKPPEIKGLWHNSWRNQLGELADPVAALARSVREAVSLTDDSQKPPIPAALAMSDLANSMEQGELLIDLIEQAGLPIAFNVPFEGMVMLRNPVHTQKVGSGRMKLSVLGPSQDHLDTLRQEWQEWVDNLPDTAPSRRPGRGGGHSLAEGLTLESAVASAESLIESVAAGARSIARATETASPDASKVTPPNRASIVLLAEEKDRSCLLTGDAAEPEILDGLKAAKKLKRGPFRCNVLKVQHHGSEHNLGLDFAKTVVADHYVFCGDGASGNPNPDVIAAIIEARRVVDPEKPYTLWFNTSETRPKSKKKQDVMKAALAKARSAAKESPGLVTVEVLKDADSALTIDV